MPVTFYRVKSGKRPVKITLASGYNHLVGPPGKAISGKKWGDDRASPKGYILLGFLSSQPVDFPLFPVDLFCSVASAALWSVELKG